MDAHKQYSWDIWLFRFNLFNSCLS